MVPAVAGVDGAPAPLGRAVAPEQGGGGRPAERGLLAPGHHGAPLRVTKCGCGLSKKKYSITNNFYVILSMGGRKICIPHQNVLKKC